MDTRTRRRWIVGGAVAALVAAGLIAYGAARDSAPSPQERTDRYLECIQDHSPAECQQ